jgi:serine/threonine protein kinase
VDVYALGVILYELLTGKVPFSHDQPMVVLQMQVTDDVPSFVARGASPALDRVEAVVRRALAKAPAERHENPLAFAASFRAAVSATPEPSTQTVRPERPLDLEDPQFMATLTPTPTSAPVWQSGAENATPSSTTPTSVRRSRRSVVLAGAVLAAGAVSAAALWSFGPDEARPPPDARATALPSPDAPPPGLRSDPSIPPRSEAPPLARAPALPSAPVPQSATPMSVAEAAWAPTSRPRPPTPRSAEADPDEAARALAREADAALLKCRCAAADAALVSLAKKPGAARLMPPLTARLADCRNIDPDHRCIDGRLEEIP